MNKKIIAIAIAAAVASPAAMAGVTVSGQYVGEMVSRDKNAATIAENTGDSTLAFEDGGNNKLYFKATAGDIYGTLGLDVGPGAASISGKATLKYRDWFIGSKIGSGSIQFGTMSGAVKNLEKDAYIATFLQSRNTYAEATTSKQYGSSSYLSNVIQYKGKVGNGTLVVQYNPTSKTTYSADEGHAGLSYKGKAGAVNYYLGYNNGAGNDVSGNSDSNLKVGGNMKFGAIKVGLNYTAADDNGTKHSAVAVDATMDMGNGLSLNANIGTTTGDTNEGTTTRLAAMKKLNKNAWVYGGVQSNKPKSGSDKQELGLGVGISF